MRLVEFRRYLDDNNALRVRFETKNGYASGKIACGCGGTQHLLGSVILEVDGDQAVSRAYVQARHQRRDDLGGPILDTSGEYIDRWERRPEGWRIIRRDAKWFTFSGDLSILPSVSDG